MVSDVPLGKQKERKVYILLLSKLYRLQFYRYTQVVLIKSDLFVKGLNNEILYIELKDDKFKLKFYHTKDKLEAPSGDCIIRGVSPFYRTDLLRGVELENDGEEPIGLQEGEQAKKQLKFMP